MDVSANKLQGRKVVSFFLLLVNQFHVLFFSGEQFEKVTKNRHFVLLKIASFA
jgi:hypothetical protein